MAMIAFALKLTKITHTEIIHQFVVAILYQSNMNFTLYSNPETEIQVKFA